MKRLFLMVAMIAGGVLYSGAQQVLWYPDIDQVKRFLDRQGTMFEDYSMALGEAYYNYYSGMLEDTDELEALKKQSYVHRDSMEAIFHYWMPRQMEITDTMVLRRLVQWHNILAATQVNEIPEVRDLQSDLEKWLVAPEDAEGKPSDEELEKMAKELLVKRNGWAKGLGFPGYIDMVMMVTGIMPESIQYWIDVIDTLSIVPYRAMIEDLKDDQDLDEVTVQDVFRLYFNYFRSGPPEPPEEERQDLLAETLNDLGMDFEELPIQQRIMQLPPPMAGQGISVRIPDDFRLVVNPTIQFSTLFHEVGHGLACVYNQNPWPVLKGYEWIAGGCNPMMAEGLAEWSAGILMDPEWMKKHTDLSAKEIKKKIKTYKTFAPVNIRFWIYNTWLEIETFNNPEQDLDSLRTSLMKQYLLVDKPSSRPYQLANSMYVSYPIYNHNLSLQE